MPNYRRCRVAGGCYFFTVNLLERSPNDVLRGAVANVKQARPFHIDAWVVLPDHLHCVKQSTDSDLLISLPKRRTEPQ